MCHCVGEGLIVYWRAMRVSTNHIDWKDTATRISQSDEQAFERIFRLLYPAIRNFLIYKGAGSESAEDIAQDTFVRLWTERHRLDPQKMSTGWLYTTAARLFLNHVRNRKVSDSISDELLVTGDPSVDIEKAEMRRQLMACVDQLPLQPRTTFLMSRIDQMKYSEIASNLNLSVKTIETHIGRALKWLRDCLQEKQ